MIKTPFVLLKATQNLSYWAWARFHYHGFTLSVDPI